MAPILLALALGGCAADDPPPATSSEDLKQTDFAIHWYPQTEKDWNVVPVVQAFQAEAPRWAVDEIEHASWADLYDGVSVSFSQQVAEYPGGAKRNMSVHITRQVVDVPYEQFIERIPVEKWGVNLDHYLGGEVLVYQSDELSRTTRQLERMVLSPFPCDLNVALTNNDMTKVEVIDYGENWGTVYWRVMYSDNNSTETDVGSVDFWGYDDETTVITFHSAHRLNAPGGIHIPSAVMKPALEQTFLDFTNHYVELVTSE